MSPEKRALISVSDKTGIVDFAQKLKGFGYQIISTGGTAALLRNEGIEVIQVQEVTGSPEMMDGRVKTLNPKIHGGILAIRDNEKHIMEAKENSIDFIDMVVVNLYPFKKAIEEVVDDVHNAIENIDVGGPTLVRAAAKNHAFVTILTDPSDYDSIIGELEKVGEVSHDTRKKLAVKAFGLTASYDSMIHAYLSNKFLENDVLHLNYVDGETLRYGENWHQEAKFFKDPEAVGNCMASVVQLHGKAMSYNNYGDADSAIQTLYHMKDSNAVAIIKHNSACGVATGKTCSEALEKAWECDSKSAFGSVIYFNSQLDLKAAEFLADKFIEIVLAPTYTEEALDFLRNKSKFLRVLTFKEAENENNIKKTYKFIAGGVLEQTRDLELYKELKVVTDNGFPEEIYPRALFAYKACKAIMSNSIVLSYEYEKGAYQAIGIGVGQPNRVDSIKLAVLKARENLGKIYEEKNPTISKEEFIEGELANCVMASEAFFPFKDNIDFTADNGVRFIITTGGSIRDEEVIQTANDRGISMIFTGMRHFRH